MTQPPGTQPPGTQPPGTQPPGTQPPDERPSDDGREPTTATGMVGRSIEEFVHQLRTFTDRARGLAQGAVPQRLSLPALPSPPGAMSAAQLRAIAQAVRAQRASMAAMRDQLEAFDQQMAVFERILDPLVEWSATWARLEEAVSDFVRREPRAEGGPPTA